MRSYDARRLCVAERVCSTSLSGCKLDLEGERGADEPLDVDVGIAGHGAEQS